jgi:hypothetical protein
MADGRFLVVSRFRHTNIVRLPVRPSCYSNSCSSGSCKLTGAGFSSRFALLGNRIVRKSVSCRCKMKDVTANAVTFDLNPRLIGDFDC